MDTRRKIISAETALNSFKGCTVFAAYFDVLSVPLIRSIAETGNSVVAVVLDPPDPVLNARTRAELAASLASVAAVVSIPQDPACFLKALEPAKIVHWEGEDAQRTAHLIEHVQSLQSA
jgi:hypothetical protein